MDFLPSGKNGAPAAPEPLLLRVGRGEAGAVRACVDRYGALVWSLVRKSIREPDRAEDAVQEIFIALWKAADRYDPARGSEALFIATIARRRLIDRFRRSMSAPEVESLEDVEVAERDPGFARVELEEEAGLALRALERLKPDQRRLLEMWAVGGMSHTEIASSSGLPLGTVKSQIRRGLMRVRALLESKRSLGAPGVSV